MFSIFQKLLMWILLGLDFFEVNGERDLFFLGLVVLYFEIIVLKIGKENRQLDEVIYVKV